MRSDEIAVAIDWAAAEGWNPGRQDAACFAYDNAQGFFIGEVAGEPAAVVSAVNYDGRFSFLGFYIVRPDLRGRGYGLRMWRTAIAHAGKRTIGLDGVPAQQDNYRKSGFALAYRNIRYGGLAAPSGRESQTVALSDVPFTALAADDVTVFPAPREAFLRTWIAAPGHHGRALVSDGRPSAWGVIRPCLKGFKIGPLVADNRKSAETVFAALIAVAGGSEIFLDVPEANRQAISLAESQGLAPIFETARMYTGAIRPLRRDRLFGVTTFELG